MYRRIGVEMRRCKLFLAVWNQLVAVGLAEIGEYFGERIGVGIADTSLSG
ncbi:hypothetical protein [Brucella pituitosa]|nr:hypothetical protein [Brucella pituitosa]